MITHVIVQNYKGLDRSEVTFGSGINILVGDNETGKSTLLEAINMALTCQLNRRSLAYELHPFLFNQNATKEYVEELRAGNRVSPPHVLVEVYLADLDEYADLKGTNNSRGDDCPGVKLTIRLDDNFSAEYEACISQPERVSSVPVEYYETLWEGFSNNSVNLRSLPVRPILIDPSAVTSNYAANRYVVEVARDFLSPEQQAELGLSYRGMREVFKKDESVVAINEKLEAESGVVTDKKLSVALDMTAKTSWESSIQPHLDELPLSQVGKGEQNAIKIKLALRSHTDRQILLIEEPENHLSHTNLGKLISFIESEASGRQVMMTTHSSFVMNKLGVENALMFNGETAAHLNDLSSDTADYFVKLPGHDTLRMVLARRSILVEGPSDELIVQKAYAQEHGRGPLENGVEVITVNSLAFERFLEIAKLLNLDVSVVTDNDGKPEKVRAKYQEYESISHIRVCFSDDADHCTLEPQLLAANGLAAMNSLLGRSDGDEAASLNWMGSNKTETALRILRSDEELKIPEYIRNAIAE